MKALLGAYGSFLLLPGWLPSLVLLLATLLDPVAGCAAWVTMLSALGARRLLPLAPGNLALELVNAMLVGHLLAATYQPGAALLGLVVAAGPLCVLTTMLVATRLTRPLCAPFVLVGLALMAVAKALLLPLVVHPAYTGYGWLCALGGIFLVPNPVSGALVALAVTAGSTYLLLLAALAYGVSFGMLWALGVPAQSFTQVLAGTQAILSAIMVGGLWLSPGRASLVLGVLAAAGSSLAYLALANLLAPLGLPPLALPFLLSTWLCLWAFWPRSSGFWRFQRLPQPCLPERSWERSTLAQARGLDPGSLALRLPFQGSWQVYQGFDGPYTHQHQWRYALDFVQQREGRSFQGQGHQLQDFYCFGAEVVAPLAGVVLACCNDCPDNAPGEVNIDQRWGNFVMIQGASGCVVMLAHLQQGSLSVTVGSWLALGQPLGRCGNSGRSPQPHLHLHVQAGGGLGSPTVPFHLTHLLRQNEFLLDCRPHPGDTLESLPEGAAFNLHLPVGRSFCYLVGHRKHTLQVELDLAGQFWLRSDRGARVAFVETPELVAFYERCGPADAVLDAFTLALGLTPLYNLESHWCDRPAARLLAGWLPWRRNLRSRYRRAWDGCYWAQHGIHGSTLSWALLDEVLGPVEFGLRRPNGEAITARLEQVGLRPDQGIPGWKLSLAPKALPAAALA
ncbi:urea transporter [bacterium]|nr:urea transporter [bacterium]